MNEDKNETVAPLDSAIRAGSALASTLFEIGASWAVYGLKVGKMALVTSAETLGKTAQALETVASELEKAKGTGAGGASDVPGSHDTAPAA